MGHGALIDGARVHSYYSPSPSALCTPLALALAPSLSPGPVCAVCCVLRALYSVLSILRCPSRSPRPSNPCSLPSRASAL